MSECKCPRDAAEALIERVHRKGCPDAGKRRGKGGKRSEETLANDAARLTSVRFPDGKARLLAAAKKAGFPAPSLFVEAMVKRIERGEKLFVDP